MRRKYDLSWRMGMIMMLLCAALIITVLPAAANYTADKNLTEKYTGTVTGGMDYTIGNSTYSPKLWNYNSTTGTNDSYFAGLTPSFSGQSPTTSKARLYVYWTWAFNNTSSVTPATDDIGVEPNMTVTFDGNVINTTKPSDRYVDWKDDSAAGTNTTTYNYPCGVYAYDVTSCVNASDSSKTYVVNVTNTKPYNGNDPSTSGDDKESFNIQAIGLLTLYNQSEGRQKSYWIDEGCDLTYLKWNTTTSSWENNIKPSDTRCWAKFSGVSVTNLDSATLITTAPSAGTQYNTLYFNSLSNIWTGLWDGSPRDKDFSWNTTEVSIYEVQDGNNWAILQNGLDDNTTSNDGQMQAANAFLLLSY